jgi:hypothetical protein
LLKKSPTRHLNQYGCHFSPPTPLTSLTSEGGAVAKTSSEKAAVCKGTPRFARGAGRRNSGDTGAKNDNADFFSDLLEPFQS